MKSMEEIIKNIEDLCSESVAKIIKHSAYGNFSQSNFYKAKCEAYAKCLELLKHKMK